MSASFLHGSAITDCTSHGHTETGYLPENFLDSFLDLVIWGHEHECLIDPRVNPEMGFSVIQPGSSVATSLCEGEAVPKHCGILSITGTKFELEKIRLKTVRPFVMREIVLANEKEMKNVWKKANNRTQVTHFLCQIVEELIEEAKNDWLNAYGEDVDESTVPLPLIRLRVEYSAPEGKFETENPQRFSNRFVGRVANVNDVIQFYRKKATVRRARLGESVDIDNKSLLEEFGSIENIKVESLVKEFLDKATLEILPQNGLGDAVGQFVDKDDRHAVETFVEESLKAYLTKMREYEDLNEEKITDIVTEHKSYLEEMFAKGQVKIKKVREPFPDPSFSADIRPNRETRNSKRSPTIGTPTSRAPGRINQQRRSTATNHWTKTVKKTMNPLLHHVAPQHVAEAVAVGVALPPQQPASPLRPKKPPHPRKRPLRKDAEGRKLRDQRKRKKRWNWTTTRRNRRHQLRELPGRRP